MTSSAQLLAALASMTFQAAGLTRSMRASETVFDVQLPQKIAAVKLAAEAIVVMLSPAPEVAVLPPHLRAAA
jgi:uncharacterized protein YqgV (UPF0045/DUF77 family)